MIDLFTMLCYGYMWLNIISWCAEMVIFTIRFVFIVLSEFIERLQLLIVANDVY